MRVLYFTRDFTTHDHRFLSSLAENSAASQPPASQPPAGKPIEVFFLRLERRGRQLEDRPLPSAVTQVVWRGGQGPFRWRDVPALLLELRSIARRLRPDVIHAGPIQNAAFLAALAGLHPLVTMSWGSDLLRDADSNRLYHWITKFTLQHSDILVGDCEAVRRKAAEFGFPGGGSARKPRVFLFPWGIDLQRFSPDSTTVQPGSESLRKRLGWQDCAAQKPFVVLSLRSWEPVYGVDVALRGFARAAHQNPDLRLMLLGGGSLAGMVHRLIQENELLDRVYLGGHTPQSDLPSIYRAADLYLSASHSDGSSVSLMEALASGKPALVSDIPGNREWVTPGQEGWLFPDGNDRAVADGLLKAAADREMLAVMGGKARRLAEERADWQKNFQVLLRAYEAATAARKPLE